jgi:hypothetical protein
LRRCSGPAARRRFVGIEERLISNDRQRDALRDDLNRAEAAARAMSIDPPATAAAIVDVVAPGVSCTFSPARLK